MKELFPHLKGMNGGKKQHWINSNLDIISMLNDIMPFDDLCKALYCKADTLSKALQKAEGHHRPTITKTEKNQLHIQKVENKVDVLFQEQAVEAEVLAEQVDRVGNLEDNLANYFSAQAHLNTIIARLVSRSKSPSDITYHISSAHKRKVGPTSRNVKLVRHSFSGLGRLQLPRPRTKETQHRRQPLKKRWPGV
jgi:hypothetical protein